MKRYIKASVDDAITTFLNTPADDITYPVVKAAVDQFFAEYSMFPDGRTLESLDPKYDKNKGQFYVKYRPFVDKCKELCSTVQATGYGRYDYIYIQIKDLLRKVDYNFPYGWKMFRGAQ